MSDGLSRRQKIIASVILFVLVIAIMVALAEGAVRLRHWMAHGQQGTVESLYHYDESSGLRVARAGYRTERVAINSLGFRGDEISDPKADGTIRIGFLGASTTFSAEVANPETWPERVVAKLRTRFPEHRFDYVNAGVPGYGVDSSIKAWVRRVKPLDPDVVVVYHATNDLSSDSRNQAIAQGVQDSDDKAQSWLYERSMLWQLAVKNVVIRFRSRGPDADGTLQFDAAAAAGQFAERIQRLVRDIGTDQRLVVMPTFAYRLRRDQSVEVAREGAVSALYYMPYMSIEALLDGYAAYNDRIRAVATTEGALLVDGELDVPGDAAHFHDSVHFTVAGNEWMAERVVNALVASERFQAMLNR